MSFLNELKRRNVLRVGAAYLVSSWLLIQVTETILPLFGFGDTPARLVVIILAIGFIPSLIFSWVFEITPEGLKKDADVVRENSITQVTGEKLDRIILVVLALALAYFAFDRFILVPARVAEIVEETAQQARTDALVESYGDKSIAVLPFVNMSDDASNEYFSDGVSEELLNLLAKMPELRVISRSSAFSFKGKDIDIPTIAKQLGVAYILEGSVRKTGNQVRITTQLIEARSDTHLWSETYDRELENIFAIQDEIASSVVRLLKIKLMGESPRVREVNPEAFALYLQARFLKNMNTLESREQAIELYRQTLAIAPDFADAWSELGTVYRRTGETQMGRQAIEQALTLDPNHAASWSRASWLAERQDGDVVEAVRLMQRALELDANDVVVLEGSAIMLWTLGRTGDAVAILEYLRTIDPLNPSIHTTLGFAYRAKGRFGDAIASFSTALRLSPSKLHDHLGLGWILLSEGELSTALATIQKEPSESYRLTGMAMTYYALGHLAESDAALAKLIEIYERSTPYNIALVMAYRRETDRAFEWLEKAVEYNDSLLAAIVNEPFFATLYSDPRWLPFLERIGKAPAQLAAFDLKVTLPE